MKQILGTLALLFSTTCLLTACVSTPAVSASPTLQNQMNDAVEKARASVKAPAFAAVVVKNGKVYLATRGHRTQAENIPVTNQDRWHIGSLTKSMTASLVGKLVDKGTLDWDSRIETLLGDSIAEMHPQYREATLRHFLAHRSGLRLNSDSFGDRMSGYTKEYLKKNGPAGPTPVGFKDGDFTGDPKIDRWHWTRAALQETPSAPLGEPKRIYENGNYVIIASVLEKVTGTSWEELIERELFVPLAMTRAGLGPPGKAGTIAEPYGHKRLKDGTVKMFPPEGPDRPDNPPVIGPSGLVHASLGDMAKYLQDHIAGHRGEKAMMEPSVYAELHKPPYGDDYAMGWIKRKSGGFGHGGTNGNWLAIMEIRPEDNIGVFVATNLGPPDQTAPAANQLIEELFSLFAE